MEAVVVGVLTSLTVGTALVLWYLLVHPDLIASLLDDGSATGEFFEGHPGLLDALTWSLGGGLILLAFLTGLATAFLGVTTY